MGLSLYKGREKLFGKVRVVRKTGKLHSYILDWVSTIAIMFSLRVPRISEDLCSACEIGNKIMWTNPQTNFILKNLLKRR